MHKLDYVALGGEAATVNGFLKECPTLSRLASIILDRRLDVREPNRASLDEVGAMLTGFGAQRMGDAGRWPR